MKKLYIGNLAWQVSDDELRDFFSEYGEVKSASVITDRETGRSRGFGFVEMDDEGADRAISQGDGKQLAGRPVRVSEARERAPRGPRMGGRY